VGFSTRYGGLPKGLERVRGVRIIDRVRAALEPVVDDLLIIANDERAVDWLPGIRCERMCCGTSAASPGFTRALVHAASPVLAVAWDMRSCQPRCFARCAMLARMRTPLCPRAIRAAGSSRCAPTTRRHASWRSNDASRPTTDA
jgi:molybdopterin-guanine dinucleotide biosynthesis protein A